MAKRKRRIDKDLLEFFDTVNLEPKHKRFIEGCVKAQQKYPQLTVKQWRTVAYLINVYSAKVLNSESATVEDNVKVVTDYKVTKTYRFDKKERTTTINYQSDK